MAARAIWKGVIRVSDFELPVKLYSAVEDRAIHFHLLHDQDMVRIRQRMANPETDETVPRERIRKGYEIRSGEYVMLEQDELDNLQAEGSRDIQVRQFVPTAAINHQWYDRPYWLGPDGDEETYFALAAALEAQDVEGVVRWVMRNKQYLGAIHAREGYLGLITLRHAEEVIPANDLDPPAGRETDQRERDMAGKLIEALEAPFDPEDYHDEYRERVRELIKLKQQGRAIEVKEVEQKSQETSLADSLAASLQALKS